jgi:Resolvase, N terminal domain
LEFLREGDVLMVTRIDRLARSIGDLQDIVRTMRARGAVLKATEQPIDTNTAADKCFLDMLGVFAEGRLWKLNAPCTHPQPSRKRKNARIARRRVFTNQDVSVDALLLQPDCRNSFAPWRLMASHIRMAGSPETVHVQIEIVEVLVWNRAIMQPCNAESTTPGQ